MPGPWEKYQQQPAAGPWQKYQATADAAPVAQGGESALDRFGSALYDSTVGAVKGVVDEVVNFYPRKRAQFQGVADVLSTKRGSPEEAAAVEKAAPLSTPASGYVLPPFTEPAYAATQQAAQGNLAGAAGTMIGAYGAPVAAAGAVKGAMAVPAAVRNSMERVNPHSAMVKALKPTAAKVQFQVALERAMPEIKAVEAELGKPIEGVADLVNGVKAAKARVWSQLETIAGPQMARGVDGSAVADAMVNSIPKKVRLENPGKVAEIVSSADKYRKVFTVQELETLLEETNAELASHYAKYPGMQRAALKANPETAHTMAQADALRDLVNKTLDSAGDGKAVAALKRRYGALRSVEDEAFRRKNVAERQAPDSLSEQVGKWQAAGKVAKAAGKAVTGDLAGALADSADAIASRKAASYIKDLSTTDSLIKRAFAQYTKLPEPIDYTPVTPRALLGEGALRTPPPGDPSGIVRGAPGPTILPRDPITDPSRLLPGGSRPPIVTPPPVDPSGLTIVPGRFANDWPSWRLLPPPK